MRRFYVEHTMKSISMNIDNLDYQMGYIRSNEAGKFLAFLVDKAGEDAPYNGEQEYSINTEKANALGFRFSALHNWIYELLDYYIQMVC